MPVMWRLIGLDALGEDFTYPEKEGIVKPFSTITVSLIFQPARPVVLQKKFIKVEVGLVSALSVHLWVCMFTGFSMHLWDANFKHEIRQVAAKYK